MNIEVWWQSVTHAYHQMRTSVETETLPQGFQRAAADPALKLPDLLIAPVLTELEADVNNLYSRLLNMFSGLKRGGFLVHAVNQLLRLFRPLCKGSASPMFRAASGQNQHLSETPTKVVCEKYQEVLPVLDGSEDI